jgi:hypothetical protein
MIGPGSDGYGDGIQSSLPSFIRTPCGHQMNLYTELPPQLDYVPGFRIGATEITRITNEENFHDFTSTSGWLVAFRDRPAHCLRDTDTV